MPLIWAHRRDYLHDMMTRDHLWLIVKLDEKWENLYSMRMRLDQIVQALSDASQGTNEDEVAIECCACWL